MSKSKDEKAKRALKPISTASGHRDAVNQAIERIEKEFGKGSIMRLGSGAITKVPVISTGILSLNLALGVGGVPRGRIMEIYGPESGGKCLDEGAYVLTAQGYKTVAEIFAEAELDLFTTYKEVPCIRGLVNEQGLVENTTHFVYNGRHVLKQITTRTGFVFSRTYKHPVQVLSKSGNMVWRWCGELCSGDFLLRRRSQYFGTNHCDYSIAYAIGVLIADGSFQEASVLVSNDDPDIKQFIEQQMVSALEFDSYHMFTEKEDHREYRLNTKEGVTVFYKKFGLCSSKAAGKYIPGWVRGLSKDKLRWFVRGYMDCECYISVQGLEVVSASYTLLYQLKLVLSQFCITGFLRKHAPVVGYEDTDYWILCITGTDFERYVEEIGTSSQRRRDQIDLFLGRSQSQDQTNYDSVPFINDLLRDLYHMQGLRDIEMGRLLEDLRYDTVLCTVSRLRKILEIAQDSPLKQKLSELLGFYFEEVLTVEDISARRTFDFAMEKTHTFIADGCINHNTTMALQIVAEAQREGGLAAFIDAEHALDLNLAQGTGVDVPNLYVAQPDYGEQALTITEELVRSGGFDVVVVDSVAALTPRAEIEGEMGDAQMGAQARLMSQALRKLTSAVSKSNCVLIFINQLRMKIGVMFGNPETTTGGNALKFYASIRLDVRQKDPIMENGVKIGHRVRIKVVKNKVAPPFRMTEADMIYGKGISKEGDTLDLAVLHGVIAKSGAWFSYKDDRLGQGRDDAVELLRKDPIFVNKIQREILDIVNPPVKEEVEQVIS